MFNYTQIEEEKVDFLEIAPVSELPNGERMFVDIGDTPIVIFQHCRATLRNWRCLHA